jgi:hypothetical protein
MKYDIVSQVESEFGIKVAFAGKISPTQFIDGVLHKFCSRCQRFAPKDKYRYGGCNECDAKRSRNYYYKNIDRVKQRDKQYREENKDRINAAQRQSWSRSPSERLKSRLKSWYGISIDRYNEMLKAQNSVCAICHLTETRFVHGKVCRLSVDHNHSCCLGEKSCGKCVRGLLCNKCNTAVGLLNEDFRRIDNLKNYLMVNK